MKKAVISVVLLMLFGISENVKAEMFTKEEVKGYLAKIGCELGVSSVFGGKKNNWPKEWIGKVSNRALCVASYGGNDIRGKKYCWVRVVDMSNGVYLDEHQASFVVAGSECNKELLRRMFTKGTTGHFGATMFGKGGGGEILIFPDVYGVEGFILEELKKGL